MKRIFTGLLFASLWGSASVATKIGLHSGQPLVISNTRFFIAGILMLFFAHFIKKERLPERNEWRPLFIYGALNVGIYLGLFVLAMTQVSAGIGTLGVGTSPLIISILNALWLKQKISKYIWIGLTISMLGVGIAIYPLLQTSNATGLGIVILAISLVSYSVGTIFFQSQEWRLPRLTINGWQVFFGGLMLFPFTIIFSDFSKNIYDATFFYSILWLAIPVSIGAVQLWLFLLKAEPLRASLWLFLCPIFGFFYANIFNNEPITIFTIVGTLLVIIGLYLGQKKVFSENE
jgi:probable blue pigment (indigoidine) exporter